MKYIYKETELALKYQNIYLEAQKNKKEKECFTGIDKNYRIVTKDSYYENISDMDALLELCIYPIYLKGHKNIKNEVQKIVEDLANSDDVLQIFQVFNLIMSQEIEMRMYTDVPFVIDFSDKIECLLHRRKELQNEMRSYNKNGFDKFNESIWESTEKICRKSKLIQQYLK